MIMTPNEIDIPSSKHVLWHKMRADLKRFLPEIVEGHLLLCPACCRLLPFSSFSVEHILPKQALSDDPLGARQALTKNERSSNTLLCNQPIYVKGQRVFNKGCNSWKGSHYDYYLREVFNGKASKGRAFTSRHHVALLSVCYLGLFAEFGYQIPLVPSGLLMRRQFFNPNKFVTDMPINCQMALMGEAPTVFEKDFSQFWTPPFKFSFEPDFCIAVVRNASLRLPISRNPQIPIAFQLKFIPPRFRLKPNFDTFFQ